MINKLVVIINSLKVPKIKKMLLYEMKFLVPNYSYLQNPWLGGYCPQIPLLSVLWPQLNLLNPCPPNKIPGYTTAGRYILDYAEDKGNRCPCIITKNHPIHPVANSRWLYVEAQKCFHSVAEWWLGTYKTGTLSANQQHRGKSVCVPQTVTCIYCLNVVQFYLLSPIFI